LLEHLARLTTDHPTELWQLNELTIAPGYAPAQPTRASRIPTSLSASRPPRHEAEGSTDAERLGRFETGRIGSDSPGEPQRYQRRCWATASDHVARRHPVR
jgi:hypothetical protein